MRRPRLPGWIRDWAPGTPREASDAVVKNLLLHALPAHATRRSLSFRASAWLGTACAALFGVTAVTGTVLLVLYVPSVERAYASVRDLETVVPFGSWIRGAHRAAAELMVLASVLHLARVFLTGSYKRGGAPGANRPLNWIVGIVLLLLTLGLSFTGYLLPWDQLAYWAVQVGTEISAAVPGIGKAVRESLLGGASIGQPTLTRFYALHCFVLPALAIALLAWHMWRIRKDGGLAVADRVAEDAVARAKAGPPAPGRTYALLGTTKGDTVASVSPSALLVSDSAPGVPNLARRAFAVAMVCLAVTSLWGLLVPAPLEGPADPSTTPNPAKAPWYFLWLQELVTDLSFRVGGAVVDGAFIGGIVLPGLLVLLLASWPWLDRSPASAAGLWFPPSRRLQNGLFLAGLAAIGILTVVGSLCRGPYWAWTWPWDPVPAPPTRF